MRIDFAIPLEIETKKKQQYIICFLAIIYLIGTNFGGNLIQMAKSYKHAKWASPPRYEQALRAIKLSSY